ncbi:hypothetical protein PMIN02_012482 [Paraphaeosphaeria minitans]
MRLFIYPRKGQDVLRQDFLPQDLLSHGLLPQGSQLQECLVAGSRDNIPFESNLALATTPKLTAPPTSTSSKAPTILFRVHAATFNPADHKVPLTPIVGSFLNTKPATPALDYAGVVEAVPDGEQDVRGWRTIDFKILDKPGLEAPCLDVVFIYNHYISRLERVYKQSRKRDATCVSFQEIIALFVVATRQS